MKTIFKATVIALILCATMMSGCIDGAKQDIIDTAIEQATKDTLFSIDLILDHRDPGVMEVRLYEGGSATIETFAVSGETSEVGTWQFYRESADHKMYDVITDNTELRVALQPGGHTIAYIYEDGFTKCGEPFYGVWEQPNDETTDDESTDDGSTSIISDIIDSVTDDKSSDPPMTLYMQGLWEDDPTLRFSLYPDGTLTSNYVDGPPEDEQPGTWKKTSQGYDIDVYPLDTIFVTILDNGKAQFKYGDFDLSGTWESGVD